MTWHQLFAGPSPRAPIEEIRRDFAYMRVPRISPTGLNDDDGERQRYIVAHHLLMIEVTGVLALATFAVGVLVIVTLVPDALCSGAASDLWPGNSFLMMFSQGASTSAFCPIVSVSSWATISLLPWLLFSLAMEFRRKDRVFFGRQKPLRALLLVGVITLIGWGLCLMPLDSSQSTFLASLPDGPVMAALKKAVVFPMAAIMTVGWVFFANTAFFHSSLARDLPS